MRQLIRMLSLFLLSTLLLMGVHPLNPSFITPTAEATVAYRATIKSLTEQAQLILHARVERQWTPKTRGPQGQIYTYTQLTPISVWSGEVTRPLLLVQLGGHIDDLHLKVHGDAEIKVGQDLVLFLTSNLGDRPPVDAQIPSDVSVHPSQDQSRQTSPHSHVSSDAFQVVHLVSLAQGVFHFESSDQGEPKLRQHLGGLVFYEPHAHVRLKTDVHSEDLERADHEMLELWSLKKLRQRVTSLKRGTR